MNLWQALSGPRRGVRLAIGQSYQRPLHRPTRANWGELVGNRGLYPVGSFLATGRRGFGDVGKSAILAMKK